MKCEGCEKELNGLLEHIEHNCPMPKKLDDPDSNLNEYYWWFVSPMGLELCKEFKKLQKND